MHMSRETVGAFIDAVYAIAVTILALEIPATVTQGPTALGDFAEVLLEYGVTFTLLFAFWVQHRRVNALSDEVERGALWLNAFVLMVACVLPRATTLVFQFGGDVTLPELEATFLQGAGWTTAEIVDLFYVLVVLALDWGILALLQLSRRLRTQEEVERLFRAKLGTSALVAAVVAASFLLPVENRYFLLVIPVALFFEAELSRLIDRGMGRAHRR